MCVCVCVCVPSGALRMYGLQSAFNGIRLFLSYVDHLCYICIVFVMLWGLFIAALWSPAWLSFVMLNCVFVTFPCGFLGQMWCLIVSIPDICPFYYFVVFVISTHVLLPFNFFLSYCGL